jgi:hypothetical protein
MFQAKKAKQADIDRKRAEVRKRLEETAKAKKAKKGFMTPERKKKLRVSRDHVMLSLSEFRVPIGQGRETHNVIFIQCCKRKVSEESRPQFKTNSCQNIGGPSALKMFPLLSIILPLLHIDVSQTSEVCHRPDQAAQYRIPHTFVPVAICDPTFGCRVRTCPILYISGTKNHCQIRGKRSWFSSTCCYKKEQKI